MEKPVLDTKKVEKTVLSYFRKMRGKTISLILAVPMLANSIAGSISGNGAMREAAIKSAKDHVIELMVKMNAGSKLDETKNVQLTQLREADISNMSMDEFVSGVNHAVPKLSDDQLLETDNYAWCNDVGFKQLQKDIQPITLEKRDFGHIKINGREDLVKTSDCKVRTIVINGVLHKNENHKGTDFHAEKGSVITSTKALRLDSAYIEPSTRIGHLILVDADNNRTDLLHLKLPDRKKYPIGYVFQPDEKITVVAGKCQYGLSKETKPHLHRETRYLDKETGQWVFVNSTTVFTHNDVYMRTEESQKAKALGGFITMELNKYETFNQFGTVQEDLEKRLARHILRQKTYEAVEVSFLQAQQEVKDRALTVLHQKQNEEQRELEEAKQDLAVVAGINGGEMIDVRKTNDDSKKNMAAIYHYNTNAEQVVAAVEKPKMPTQLSSGYTSTASQAGLKWSYQYV